MNKQYAYKLDLSDNSAPAKVVELVGHNKLVLEVGSASGVQSRVLKNHFGCSVTGIEVDPHAAKAAEEFCEQMIIGDVEQMDLTAALKKKYDVILFADVLEHLKDPGRVLRQCRQLLKHGGYVVASIPNVAHAAVIFEMIHGHFDYRQYGLLDDTHIRFFTKKTIFKMFADAGYTISALDRVLRAPSQTEFRTRPNNDDGERVLKYIEEHNDESMTFQFIIKAYASQEEASATVSSLIRTSDKESARLKEALYQKERELRQLESRIKQLRCDVDWISDRLIVKLLQKLSRAFRGNKAKIYE